MTETLDPVFTEALRRELVSLPATEPARARRTRRTWTSAGLGLVLAIGGSAAAATLLGPPGSEVVTALADDVEYTGTGSATIDLGAPPEGTTVIAYEFTCVTAGTFHIGQGGTTHVCDGLDADAGHPGNGQLALSSAPDGQLTIATDSDARWTISATYVATEPIPLATNANGESYGTDGFGAQPDLIEAIATNGQVGYIRSDDLDEASGANVANPDEAVEWTKHTEEMRAAGEVITIPVYEADGTTVIGEFLIQP